MVNINLYKKKKSKLKLTTVLFLIAILLLPVLALRVTIETIKQSKLSDIRAEYQYARSYIGTEDIEPMINRIKAENVKTVNKTAMIRVETDRIKKDLIYAGRSTAFVGEMGIQYDRYKANEKIFIESMTVKRGQDFFVKYYNVTENHQIDYGFSEGLKKAYQSSGMLITDKKVTIDFMLVNILQEELTAKTAKY
ncbi:MAG TPA: hypothetical protein P5107_10635 [Thermotogota bacterium]|nr:hypothetical protein [Thermotogota bacterium]HRW35499.1 hypothetical protein [Thermotogota bacterium]